MAVIINDLELVAEPPPAAAGADAAAAAQTPPEAPAAPNPMDLLSVLEQAEERAARLRAH